MLSAARDTLLSPYQVPKLSLMNLQNEYLICRLPHVAGDWKLFSMKGFFFFF